MLRPTKILQLPNLVLVSSIFLFLMMSTYGSTQYNLGVVILGNVAAPSMTLRNYRSNLTCAINYDVDSSLDLGVKLTNVDLNQLSPRSIIDALCQFEMEVSSVVLILPDSNSYDYLPIYKYAVNHISSLGIPLIVWNSYMPNNQVYRTIVQMGPQYEQQAEAYVSLLKYYKWSKFSLLTTECPGHIEFKSAIRRLIHDQVKKKGEPLMEILSSHHIKRGESIMDNLRKLRASDTRVILLHMTGTEVVEVMSVARTLQMVGKEHMWLGTTQIYDKSAFQPKKLPIGMIALAYVAYDKPDTLSNQLTQAMITTANFWRETIIKYNKTGMDKFDRPTMMSCSNADSTKFWRSGKALYNAMTGYTIAKKDIGCGPKSQEMNTMAIDIDQNGLNREASLIFLNLAPGESSNNIWKSIGSWQAPDTVELRDIAWPGHSAKPPDGKPARSFLRVVTHNEPPYVKFTDPNPITGECDLIGAVMVKLTSLNSSVCPECTRNKTLFQCATGLCIDLLTKLQEDMQFNYELFQARDNNWGNYIDDGTGKKQWNGLIKDLMEGYADISMTSLKIGKERNEAIDFSVPFIETGITIIVLIKKGVISATAFLEPYETSVWVIVCSGLSIGIGINIFVFEWGSPKGLISLNKKTYLKEPYNLAIWMVVLVGMVHVVGFFILFFDYHSPAGHERYTKNIWKGEKFSLARSLWLIWTILFGAAVETDNTKGLASRFLTAIWSLFSLVFLASYTANLAAFMITKEEFFDLRGLNDERLMNPQSVSPPFRFGTVPDGSTAINLKNNQPDMFSYMERFNKKTVIDGIKAVKNSELHAFIYDATVLEYEASRDEDCKLTTVGNWYAMTGYGVGFPKGSKWKDKFDQLLTKYISQGEMDRLRKFWMTGACDKASNSKGRESSHSLDIANFTSAYILLIAGVGSAILLSLFEHIYFTFVRRKLRRIDKSGCCSLLSLSMGESLSFEETVMEVLESTMHMTCQNDLCKANQQRLSHELDMAICRLNMIQAMMHRSQNKDDLQGKPSIWAKAARFAGKMERPAIRDKEMKQDKEERQEEGKELITIRSNEHLESVVSCL